MCVTKIHAVMGASISLRFRKLTTLTLLVCPWKIFNFKDEHTEIQKVRKIL